MTNEPQPPASARKYLAWTWDQQSRWSQRGHRLKTQLDRARLAALVLTVCAAAAVTVAAQIAPHSIGVSRAFAIAGAIFGASVPYARSWASAGTVEAWTRTRSVSESLKRIVYTYLAGVSPYRDEQRHARFQADVEELLARTDEHLSAAVTTFAPQARSVPDIHTVDDYIAGRVVKQMSGYYTQKSREMGRRATVFQWIEYVLIALGIAFAAIAATYPDHWPAAWVAVITTAGASLAAYAAVQRFGALRLEYAYAAGQLGRLLLNRPDQADEHYQAPTPEMDDAFVSECELVISNQNEDWMAGSLKAAQADALAAHKRTTEVAD